LYFNSLISVVLLYFICNGTLYGCFSPATASRFRALGLVFYKCLCDYQRTNFNYSHGLQLSPKVIFGVALGGLSGVFCFKRLWRFIFNKPNVVIGSVTTAIALYFTESGTSQASKNLPKLSIWI
jgi:hypothetical protein